MTPSALRLSLHGLAAAALGGAATALGQILLAPGDFHWDAASLHRYAAAAAGGAVIAVLAYFRQSPLPPAAAEKP
ncbi:MAG TPA: hypothetical protein VE996_08315 [Terriglobales bacterium]|nr:hypothetical protein [Terriglobales bacterium]